MSTSCGIYLQDKHSLRECIELARYAEEKGFDSIWQAESRLAREATVPMAAYLVSTERIKVGAGVLNNWTRNAAALACAFSTLDDLAPGRVLLGVGAWYDPLAAKVGIKRRKTLTAMRETVEAVGRLLANETVTYDGEFVQLDGVELDYVYQERRPKDVPIYIGATGPKMLELTGEIADGVLLNYLVPPEYNERAMEHLEAGARRTGRSALDLDRPQLVVCSVSHDRQAALDGARRLVAQYLGQQAHIMKASGVPESLLEAVAKVLTWPATPEQVTEAAKLVPDEIVQLVSASGTPDEARAKVREYVDRGCTSPILYPLGDARLMIDTFADWS
jgi:5,10-methylenetetrahydromethanopterin reductase